ncbi:MAG: phosphotransferase [Candidatus Paceibacterota bacterium]
MLEKNNLNEGVATEVNFTNQPKYSEHEVDNDFNERREALLPLIKEFISTHPLFLNKKVDVTFMHSGVSCLVCRIDAPENKIILKIPLSIINPRLEGKFLKAWEDVGVKVPHVFEEGPIGNHFYILMEYIDAKTLNEVSTHEELLEKDIYRELGAIMRKMHQVKSYGYGEAVNTEDKPKYKNAEEWLNNDERLKGILKYTTDHNLLDDEKHGSLEYSINIIKTKTLPKNETVYCHNDFGKNNILATNPPTIFDPWPSFNHPYMDIARMIAVAGSESVEREFTAGYFDGEFCDRQLLQAFVVLNVAIKIPYAHKQNALGRIEKMHKYLENTKKYLD